MPQTEQGGGSYASEALQRIEYVMKYLQEVQAGKWSPAVPALWNLWALEDASSHAGFEDIARLCRRMEAPLRTVLPPHMNKNSERQIEALLRASSYIMAHARGVAKRWDTSRLPDAAARDFGLGSPLG